MNLSEEEAMNNVNYYTMSGYEKFIHKLKAFFVGFFSGLFTFVITLPGNVAGFFVAIGKKLKYLLDVFIEGDIATKLSFFVLGFSNLIRGQLIKGLLLLTGEITFLLFMATGGVHFIGGLRTLGTQTQHIEAKPNQVPKLVPGDNSMLMLLFGVAALFVVAAFIIVYFINISTAIEAQRIKRTGEQLPSFKEECKAFLDGKFHVTLLTLPIIGVFAFTLLPLTFMILIAFTNFDSVHQPPGNLFHWVGLDSFKTIFTAGGAIGNTFWPVLGWTLTWAVIATFTNYILGILLALLINKKEIKFKTLFRTIFVLSIAVPQIVSLLLLRNMLDDDGPINGLLQSIGFIHNYIPFLSDATYARASVLVVNLWIGIPFTMLATSGILMNIPADLYEAAKIDGASRFAMFVKITMPYVVFVTTPTLITQFIGNINNFNVIYLLLGGGPSSLNYYQAGKTDLLVTWLYKLTLNSRDYCYASAIGIAVFVLSALFSLIAYRNTNAYKNEEAFQ